MKPKVIWQCVYPILLHFAVSTFIGYTYIIGYILFMAFSNSGKVIQENALESYMSHSLYFIAGAAIITIPLLYLLLQGRRKKEGMPQWNKESKKSLWVLLVIMSVCMCISFNTLISYSGIERLSNSYQETAEALYSGGFVLELVVVGILAPISEELIFRGMIFETLYRYTRPVIAAVISALMFAVYHGNLVQGVYAFCIGCILAYFCKRYGTLLAPILAHITANVISVCITEIDLIGNIFENSIICIVLTITTTLIWIGGTTYLMKKNFK